MNNNEGASTITNHMEELVEQSWIEKWVLNKKVFVTDGTCALWPGIVVGPTADSTGVWVKLVPFYRGFIKIINSSHIMDINEENYESNIQHLNKRNKKKFKIASKCCLESTVYTREHLLKNFNSQKVSLSKYIIFQI